MFFNIVNMFTGASELLSGPLPQMMKGSLEIYTEQMISGFSKSTWFIIENFILIYFIQKKMHFQFCIVLDAANKFI